MTKKISPQEIQQYTLAQMHDYTNAAQYLMLNALTSGDQRAVRAIKTLMDTASRIQQALKDSTNLLQQSQQQEPPQ